MLRVFLFICVVFGFRFCSFFYTTVKSIRILLWVCTSTELYCHSSNWTYQQNNSNYNPSCLLNVIVYAKNCLKVMHLQSKCWPFDLTHTSQRSLFMITLSWALPILLFVYLGSSISLQTDIFPKAKSSKVWKQVHTIHFGSCSGNFHVCVTAPSCGLKRANTYKGPLLEFVLICVFYCTIATPFTEAFVISELLCGCTIKSLFQMMGRHLSCGLEKTTESASWCAYCILTWRHPDIFRHFKTHIFFFHSCAAVPSLPVTHLIPVNLYCTSPTPCRALCTCCVAASWFSLHYDEHIEWQSGGFTGSCKSRENKQTQVLSFHWHSDNRKVLWKPLWRWGKHLQRAIWCNKSV